MTSMLDALRRVENLPPIPGEPLDAGEPSESQGARRGPETPVKAPRASPPAAEARHGEEPVRPDGPNTLLAAIPAGSPLTVVLARPDGEADSAALDAFYDDLAAARGARVLVVRIERPARSSAEGPARVGKHEVWSAEEGEVSADTIRAIRGAYDLSALDTPSLSEAVRLANAADGALVVVRLNQTPRDAARRCVDQLRRAGCPVWGCIACT